MNMKNIINKLVAIALGMAVVVSCAEPDNAIYSILDGMTHGAALRGLDVTSSNYDIADPNSKFEVVVEEQDELKGKLFDKLNVYIAYNDKYDDGIDNNQAEKLLKSVAASAFTTSAAGLPTATVAVTLGEVVSAFGFVSGNYNAADLITIRLEIVLTDGRTFSTAQGSGAMQGSYFASPYEYTAAILCKPMPGDYRIDMHDSYGDGWQTNDGNGGNGIQVTLGDGTVLEAGMCSPYQDAPYAGCVAGDGYEAVTMITIPVGTESAEWYFPGDSYGEISFEIYAPTGEELYNSGGTGATGAGSLPVVKCLL